MTFLTLHASADTVSHTDCSRGYSVNTTGQHGACWQQTTYGGVYNFHPNGSGYSLLSGWVECDTVSHQIYLYESPLLSSNWTYIAGDTAFNAGSVYVIAIWDCGAFVPLCRNVRYQFIEDGYIWNEYVYRAI